MIRRTSTVCLALIAVTSVALLAPPAWAAAGAWDGLSTDWTQYNSWYTAPAGTTFIPPLNGNNLNGVPGSNVNTGNSSTTYKDTVTISWNGITNAPVIVDLNATQGVGTLTFSANAGTTTLLGGDANHILALNGSPLTVTNGAGAVTIGSATPGQHVDLLVELNGNLNIINNSANVLTIANNVSVSSNAAATITIAATATGTGGTTFNGIISDGGLAQLAETMAIQINSAAGTTTLAGANTYSGGTTITSGNLKLGAGGTLGSVNGTLTTKAGTLDLNGNDLSVGIFTSTGSAVTIFNNGGGNRNFTIGNNNGAGTYTGVIADHTSGAGTIALTKNGTGTETLNGNNTFTGTTTVNSGLLTFGGTDTTGSITMNAGSLQIGSGTTGSLTATPGFNFNGSSTVTVKEANASTQIVGVLAFNGGETTIVSTYGTSGTTTLTATGVARSAGATVNLTTVGGAIGTPGAAGTNVINFSTALPSGFISTGAFLNGSNYAYYDASGATAFIRGIVYGTDANSTAVSGTATTLGALTPATNTQYAGSSGAANTVNGGTAASTTLTLNDATGFLPGQAITGTGIAPNTWITNVAGNVLTLSQTATVSDTTSVSGYHSVSAQTTDSLNTLNLSGLGASLTLAPSQTLTVNGILRSGNNTGITGVISGGTGIQAANNELVVRTDQAGDSLEINTPILANGTNLLTKSGAGALTLSAANTYTGGTTVNAGSLLISGTGTLGATSGNLTIAGGTVDLGGTTQTVGSLNVTMPPATGNSLQNGSLIANSYAASNPSGTATISASLLANGSAGFTMNGTGTVVLTSSTNTYSGGTTISKGTLQFNDALAGATGTMLSAGTGPITLGDSNSGSSNIQLNLNPTMGGTVVMSNPITVTNQGTGTKTINFSLTSGTFGTGPITLNGPATISGSGLTGQLNFTSVVSGNGLLTFTSTGNQQLVLDPSGTSRWPNFTGDIDIQKGVSLTVRDALSSPTGNNVTVEAGATFIPASSTNTVINALNGSGRINNIGTGFSLTVGIGNGSGVFSGILGSAGTLIKEGTGTQEFNGPNSGGNNGGGSGPSLPKNTQINNGVLKLTELIGMDMGQTITLTFGSLNNPVLIFNTPDAGDQWTFKNADTMTGGANATWEKLGAGTFTVGANTVFTSYTGTIAINNGTLVDAANQTTQVEILPSASPYVFGDATANTAGTLDLFNANQTITSLSSVGTSTTNSIIASKGAITGSHITVLTLALTGNNTFSGGFGVGVAGTNTKNNFTVNLTSGTLTLGGASTVAGTTTVSSGANLTLSSTGSFGAASPVFITGTSTSSYGSLGGTGTLAGTAANSAAVTIGAFGHLAPSLGTGTTANTLHVTGTLSPQGGSFLDTVFTLNGAANDTISGSNGSTNVGTLALPATGSMTVNLYNAAGGLANGTYTLFSNFASISGPAVSSVFAVGATPFTTDKTYVFSSTSSSVSLTIGDPVDITWDGLGADANWSTGGNWVGGSAPQTAANRIVFAGTTQLTPNFDFPSAFAVFGVTFDSTAGAFTLNGTNTLALNGNLLNNSSNNQIINMPLAINGARTVDTGAQNVTLNGNLTGGGSMTKNGTGTLFLNGSNSGYAGDLTINNGTVMAGNANAVFASTLNLASTGTLDLNGNNAPLVGLTGSGTITSSATGVLSVTTGGNNISTSFSGVIQNGSATSISLTKSGTGTLTLSGANTYTGGTFITGGTVILAANNTLGPGNLSISNGATLSMNRFSASVGNLTLTSGTISTPNLPNPLSGTLTTTGVTAVSGTINAALSGTGGFTKNGAGNTVTFQPLPAGTNYSGPTTINGGELDLIISNDFSGVNSTVTVNPGTTLYPASIQFGGTQFDPGSYYHLPASMPITLNDGTLLLAKGNSPAFIDGVVTVAGTSAGSTVTLSSATSNGHMPFNFASGFAGTNQKLTIDASATGLVLNNYDPHVNWQADGGYSGSVTFIGPNAAGNDAVLGMNTSAVQNALINTDLTLTGSTTNPHDTVLGIIGGGTFQIRSLAGNVAGYVQTDSARAVVLGTNNSTTNTTSYAGYMGGIMTLTKNGTYTQELSGAGITYSGATTLNQGTLRVTNATGFASTVSISSSDSPILQLNAIASTDAWTLSKQILGINSSAQVQKIGAGTVTLAAANSYDAPTIINGGALNVDGSLSANSAVTVNDTGTLAGIGMVGGPVTLVGGATGAGIGSAGTLALAGSLTVSGTNNSLGSGTVSVAGATTINSPAIFTVNGTLSGAGRTTVGGTLRGGGTVSEPVTVVTGGAIGGASGTSLTLTGGLTLNDGSLSSFALTSAAVNNTTALVAITGGFSGPGSTTNTINFTGSATQGTYDLYSYDTGALTLNQFALGTHPSGNFTYSLAIAGNQVDLIVGPPAASATWNSAGNGVYSDTTKWDPTQLPAAAGLSATFAGGTSSLINSTTVGGNAISITVDGAYTIGSLIFDNPTVGYTLASDSISTHGLTLDNGGAVIGSFTGAVVTVNTGSHAISTKLTLADSAGTTFNLASGTSLAISGPISGTAGSSQALTLTGGGTLTLGQTNTYTGGVTVNAGTLRTTANGALGSGPLTVNATSGTTTVQIQGVESVSGLSSNISGGSAAVDVAAGGSLTENTAAGSTTFAGTIDLASGATSGSGGKFAKTGAGTEILTSAPQLRGNNVLTVSGGTLRVAATAGTANVGTGVVANISGATTLELAGPISALGTPTAGHRVQITNNSTAAVGVLVSGGNQQVGDITGSGTVQVNAATSLTADGITASSLVIGGDAMNSALVTIAASDDNGNPLATSDFALAGSLASSAPFASGALSSSSLLAGADASAAGAAASGLTLGGTSLGGGVAAVPEPSSVVLILVGGLAGMMYYAARSRRRAAT